MSLDFSDAPMEAENLTNEGEMNGEQAITFAISSALESLERIANAVEAIASTLQEVPDEEIAVEDLAPVEEIKKAPSRKSKKDV